MFTKLHTPKGTKDYLPIEVKCYRYIEEKLRENFELWGYNEIRSPTIEFVETLSTGVGPELVDAMFKFQDFDGKILALRAEMTAPVARIVTTRMTGTPEPIRLFYLANAFRYSQSYIERGREFWQAGVELLGCKNSKADGEILALLVSSLKRIGLKDVRIDVGHAGILKDLLKATGLNKEKKSILKNILTYRDKFRLEKFMDQNNLSSKLKEAFLQLSRCRRLNDILSVSLSSLINGKTRDHLRTLSELKDALSGYGIDNLVFFDFSLTRKIEYYTGMVFEASVPNLGQPLGGGGRYDDFVERFGNLQLPATGFALEIEKCLQALTAQGFRIPEKQKTRILVSSKFRYSAIKAVKIFRDAGITTLLDMMESVEEKTINYAKLAGIDYVVFVDSSLKKSSKIYDVESDAYRKMMIETFLQGIGDQP